MTIESLRPEARLILLASRTRINPDDVRSILDLLSAPLDSDLLLRIASRQGVTQFLHSTLAAHAPSALPDDARRLLHERFQVNARHAMMLSGEMLKLISLLDEHAIATIPYKGPTLAMMLYGNVALRQFQDVDLLLHRSDLLRARDLLMAEGYVPQFELEGARARSFLDAQHQLMLRRHADNSIVELHWGISPRYFSFPFDIEGLWTRIEHRTMFGRTLPTLALDDLLLILAAHGAKHNWERLAWICDIAELLRRHRDDMDWEMLLERASKLGSERMVLLAIRLAEELLGAEVPAILTGRMERHPELAELGEDVLRQIFGSESYNVEVMHRSNFHLRTRERLSDRIRYGIGRATQPTMEDWEQLRLPPMFARWLPVIRPFRLAVKHGRRLLGRLFA